MTADWTIAAAIQKADLAAPALRWLREEASRSDIDDGARLRVVQTLGYLRMEASGVPLSRTGPWDQRKRLYQQYREVRAELAELPLWLIHIAWPITGITWLIFLGEQMWDELNVLVGRQP